MEVVLIKIAQVVAAFSLLIVLHEGGHFLFAKLFKIRVEKFYLFFDFPIMTPRPQFAFFTYRQGKFSFLKYTKITIPKKDLRHGIWNRMVTSGRICQHLRYD